MMLDPQPMPSWLADVYGSDYFENTRFFDASGAEIRGYPDYLAERFARQQDFQRVLDRIASFLPSRDSAASPTLLDVGCGPGYLLDAADDRGFRVAGVEYNGWAAERTRRKYGFPVTIGDFLDYEGPSCDVITMLDVIEPLYRPMEAVAHAASLTRPGGLFVVSTMDSDSLASRLLGRRLEDFRRVSEHLYFFNRRTIRESLERVGFEVLRIDWYGLTIRLDSLAARAGLAFPRLGRLLGGLVRGLGLARQQVYFNPGTKMIVYARKASPSNDAS